MRKLMIRFLDIVMFFACGYFGICCFRSVRQTPEISGKIWIIFVGIMMMWLVLSTVYKKIVVYLPVWMQWPRFKRHQRKLISEAKSFYYKVSYSFIGAVIVELPHRFKEGGMLEVLDTVDGWQKMLIAERKDCYQNWTVNQKERKELTGLENIYVSTTD